MVAVQETIECVRRIDVDQYRYGFETLIDSERLQRGCRKIPSNSSRRRQNEPAWMLLWQARSLSPPGDHDRADLGTLQRGLTQKEAVGPVVNGFVKDGSSSCRWNSQWRRRS